ncbi:hypothetical protein SMACR_04521 [Sordaria macrospora]|uniref:Uncharacterized protein n=2 Tax=Sordaria macrospora TaxID=5147 RepID=A0A8S8ZN30_SORMA|nr:hypothetical protein SMACR_04521 [Sordaria macrospora]
MDRIGSVREKPDTGRRHSRRESRRERERGDAHAGYGDEKGLERKNTTKKERDGHRYSEKETLSRSSTTRTSRTCSTSTPSWDPRPSTPPQQQEGGSKLKRAGTLSRLSRFLTGKRKEDDPDYDVTPGTGSGSGSGGFNANGSRVHRSATVSARPRPQTQPQPDWTRAPQPGTGRRQRATTFDDILAGIPGQH